MYHNIFDRMNLIINSMGTEFNKYSREKRLKMTIFIKSSVMISFQSLLCVSNPFAYVFYVFIYVVNTQRWPFRWWKRIRKSVHYFYPCFDSLYNFIYSFFLIISWFRDFGFGMFSFVYCILYTCHFN